MKWLVGSGTWLEFISHGPDRGGSVQGRPVPTKGFSPHPLLNLQPSFASSVWVFSVPFLCCHSFAVFSEFCCPKSFFLSFFIFPFRFFFFRRLLSHASQPPSRSVFESKPVCRHGNQRFSHSLPFERFRFCNRQPRDSLLPFFAIEIRTDFLTSESIGRQTAHCTTVAIFSFPFSLRFCKFPFSSILFLKLILDLDLSCLPDPQPCCFSRAPFVGAVT